MSPEPIGLRPLPQRLCSYRFQTWLRADRTALCLSESGRRVVLKSLPAECLLGESLHPLVRDRLGHIQQMAHRQMATLVGVERDRRLGVWLVWEYLEGQPLDQYLADPACSPRQTLLALREVLLATAALHAMGLVHGAIYSRNIIVTATEELKLTHVSPLLHQDPLADKVAIAELLRLALDGRGLRHTPAGEIIRRQLEHNAELPEVASELGRLLAESPAARVHPRDDGENRYRRKAVGAAVAVAALTLLAAAIVWWYLFARVLKPARPPEAAPQLLQPRGS